MTAHLAHINKTTETCDEQRSARETNPKEKKEESEAKKVDESESKTHTHTHTHRHPTRTAIISHHNDAQTRSKSWTRSTKGISACFARSKLIEFIMSDICACKRVCLCVCLCVSYISMCFQWAFNQTLPSCDILNIIYMKCQWNLREASPHGSCQIYYTLNILSHKS